MTRPISNPVRCAIYTRKSSEEGLEQDFNSLHAQREACEAYVFSQKHEGWRLLTEPYDDGGISGGTMQRPALQRLLDDIKAKKVDIIVVYKVDRLTRSLADFARMVELFDQHQVSFVSVTQQFNTTTSMGRLTLNVLLSFAQFEREVTSERIRDKVKASKQKGMWMGGPVPFGYRVQDRKLIVHGEEAKTVKWIYESYLQVGSVRLLLERIETTKIQRPIKPSIEDSGMRPFNRSMLDNLLSNPLYIGKVRQAGVHYDGMHDAIIELPLWEAVQAHTQRVGPGKNWRPPIAETSPLRHKLFDSEGRRLVPISSRRNGRHNRYYISETLRRGPDPSGWRLPGIKVDQIVAEQTRDMLANTMALSDTFHRAQLNASHLQGFLARAAVVAIPTSSDDIKQQATEQHQLLTDYVAEVRVQADQLHLNLTLDALLPAEARQATEPLLLSKIVPIQLRRRGVEMRMVVEQATKPPHVDPPMISLIAKGHIWFEQWLKGEITGYKDIVEREGISASYVGDVMALAFLSPKLVEGIIQGRQPDDLKISHLTRVERLPLRWDEQVAYYGWK